MESLTSAHEHYERGRALKLARMFDQAREEFQHAATNPHYAGNAYVQIALCLRATGRYDDAVEAFRQALEVDTFSSKERAHLL
jgi:tetratricopeptide (TPR) repeat protein